MIRRYVWTYPILIALGVGAMFSLQFLFAFPFSGYVLVGNYETYATKVSFFLYAKEEFSFPFGFIRSLAAPFQEANIGNVGALPLVALTAKILGKGFPYFQTFDYFVFVEIFSCVVLTYFAVKIIVRLGVDHVLFQVACGVFVGLSFLIVARDNQTFCVVAMPVYAGFFYYAMSLLVERTWKLSRALPFVLLFPVAILLDSYAFIAIVLASVVMSMICFFETIVWCGEKLLIRSAQVSGSLVIGCILALVSLVLIGMYPLPQAGDVFTSYDGGMGGRWHVADLFAPIILHERSFFAWEQLPFTTADLSGGQYEGVGYIGTALIALWVVVSGGMVRQWVVNRKRPFLNQIRVIRRSRRRPMSPWKKVGLGTVVVFLFSLGYQLTIFGIPLVEFAGMPAALAADLLPPLYNFRAPGRWMSMFSLFLIIWTVKVLFDISKSVGMSNSSKSIWGAGFSKKLLMITVVVHLVEISPLLYPRPAEAAMPIGGAYTNAEVEQLRLLGEKHSMVLIAPGVPRRMWTTEAFSAAYYLGLKSNLYYVGRPIPQNRHKIRSDLQLVLAGQWEPLNHEYGDHILIALSHPYAEVIREKVAGRYKEVIIGPLSLWKLKNGGELSEDG